jgi:hypothetical protein
MSSRTGRTIAAKVAPLGGATGGSGVRRTFRPVRVQVAAG